MESEYFRFQGTSMKTVKINTLFILIKIFHATFYVIFLKPKRNGQRLIFPELALCSDKENTHQQVDFSPNKLHHYLNEKIETHDMATSEMPRAGTKIPN